MNFKLDENLDVRLVHLLEGDGHNATSVKLQDLSGIDDGRLLEICRDEDRVLITLDLDFSNVIQYPPENTPGIVVLRGPNQELPTMRRLIETLVQALKVELPGGRLWIVEPGRLPVHESTQ